MGSVTLIKKAKHLIKRYGWIRYSFGDRERGFCVLGALRAADNQKFTPAYNMAIKRVRKTLARAKYPSAVYDDFPVIDSWNDDEKFGAKNRAHVQRILTKAMKVK